MEKIKDCMTLDLFHYEKKSNTDPWSSFSLYNCYTYNTIMYVCISQYQFVPLSLAYFALVLRKVLHSS